MNTRKILTIMIKVLTTAVIILITYSMVILFLFYIVRLVSRNRSQTRATNKQRRQDKKVTRIRNRAGYGLLLPHSHTK